MLRNTSGSGAGIAVVVLMIGVAVGVWLFKDQPEQLGEFIVAVFHSLCKSEQHGTPTSSLGSNSRASVEDPSTSANSSNASEQEGGGVLRREPYSIPGNSYL
jgi:hypothetical protein